MHEFLQYQSPGFRTVYHRRTGGAIAAPVCYAKIRQKEFLLKNITNLDLVKIAVIAAIYFVLTITVAPFGFGPIQFRFAEILNLLAFFNPIYIIAVALGCFLSNLFSPFGIYDVFFGTLHTLISLLFIWKSPRILSASVWPAVFSLIIAFELKLVLNVPFLETWFFVGLSELIICSVIAVPIMWFINKSGFIRDFIQVKPHPKWLNNPIWPKLLLDQKDLK